MWLALVDNMLAGSLSRFLVAGLFVETLSKAIRGDRSMFSGSMIPAESLNRVLYYGLNAVADTTTGEWDKLQSDLWKTIEGMAAPLRYGGELYRNRIAE